MRWSALSSAVRGLGAAALAAAVANPSAAEAQTGERLVLFGAYWCAPCMAEYRGLPAIVSAATPRTRVVLAWIDKPIEIPSGLAGRTDAISAREARKLAVQVLGQGFGLPAAAVLNPDGKACAIRRAPMQVDDVAPLLEKCRSAASPGR